MIPVIILKLIVKKFANSGIDKPILIINKAKRKYPKIRPSEYKTEISIILNLLLILLFIIKDKLEILVAKGQGLIEIKTPIQKQLKINSYNKNSEIKPLKTNTKNDKMILSEEG